MPHQAKNLIIGMLHPDPAARPTLEQILAHPWLSSSATTPPTAIVSARAAEAEGGAGSDRHHRPPLVSTALLPQHPPSRPSHRRRSHSYLLHTRQRPSLPHQGSSHSLSTICRCSGVERGVSAGGIRRTEAASQGV